MTTLLRLRSPSEDRLQWPAVQLVWPRPRTWRLLEDYRFEWSATGHPRQRIEIQAGFEFDGASVPALVEWYLGRELILAESVPHDLIYHYQGRVPPGSHLYWDGDAGLWLPADHVWTRKEGDRLFGRQLRSNPLIRPDQRRLAYRMVRAVGWWAWAKNSAPPSLRG